MIDYNLLNDEDDDLTISKFEAATAIGLVVFFVVTTILNNIT